ncbi:hypothetical protein JCGZ_10281 [Jatropha curcas]|uniref:Uncharacterized protein n=1 Tax=Jatropha curcas TaxID=180498 RepID=A0A067LD80_JATCU|nr:hypothetical protein JCGZ_10281 [Jatropha curcas]
MYYEHHHLPCLHCQPQEYIRMVQHLIERCLLFHMNRDDCVKALAKHASVHPTVTSTGRLARRELNYRRRKHWKTFRNT